MPGTVSAIAATADTPTSAGRRPLTRADSRGNGGSNSAPITATTANAAASVSANWGSSWTSSPVTKPMPLVLASTQPPTAAALPATPSSATAREGRTSTSAPQPIWNAAVSANATTAARCSLCAPAAVAWIAPAPIDARAATETSALGRSDGEAVATAIFPSRCQPAEARLEQRRRQLHAACRFHEPAAAARSAATAS